MTFGFPSLTAVVINCSSFLMALILVCSEENKFLFYYTYQLIPSFLNLQMLLVFYIRICRKNVDRLTVLFFLYSYFLEFFPLIFFLLFLFCFWFSIYPENDGYATYVVIVLLEMNSMTYLYAMNSLLDNGERDL